MSRRRLQMGAVEPDTKGRRHQVNARLDAGHFGYRASIHNRAWLAGDQHVDDTLGLTGE